MMDSWITPPTSIPGRMAAGLMLVVSWLTHLHGSEFEVAGLVVVPHEPTIANDIRYAAGRGPVDGARVQVFLRNVGPDPLTLGPDAAIALDGATPDALVESGDWTWHDFPSQWPANPLVVPAGDLTVMSFNAAGGGWGLGTACKLGILDQDRLPILVEHPQVWLSAVTFLRRAAADDESIQSTQPDTLIVHVENASKQGWRLAGVRLWTPGPGSSHRTLHAGPWLADWAPFPEGGLVPPEDSGGLLAPVANVPLSYAAVEVHIRSEDGTERSLWSHLRVKRERFVIGGGWVNSKLASGSSLRAVNYLRTLRRMHVDSGMHGFVPGYTDDPTRWDICPLAYMSACRPIEKYDTDDVLPRIHAVECLGEPQYGGGRPVPPAEVWRDLSLYAGSRLPTSVTHSEERIWRLYAGLSDYPHFDAYRVCAPAADVWRRYDRWEGATIRWAAPLETIGDMTRSLRELNRPVPIAAWSQGAHEGWDPIGGRSRTSPTPDELVVQAWHAMAARITSLYWFNLSLPSIVKFRDLIEPITRVSREALVLAPLMLEGTAGRYERQLRADGRPDWDLSTICGPNAAILFAIDLDYQPDPDAKVFVFGAARPASWRYRLPGYLANVADVFSIDADGIRDAAWRRDGAGIVIEGNADRIAIHVATADSELRHHLEAERRRLVDRERQTGFDPANDDDDFGCLVALLGQESSSRANDCEADAVDAGETPAQR